ncbi:MAG TPA: thioesterase domain-containing protein [Ktedonobacteraceae bacterium]|jgi:medium-chain acyl-[acyl-carrier-protein] hydrolase|nr:thioesterase domain-containing protein [Ktedonobacteraceae bacterium]
MNVSAVSLWLQYWQRKPNARIRLFCFHYAGGGASLYRSWSEQTPPLIEICPVQLPGRESRLPEKPFDRLEALLPPLAEALGPYLDMPYAFFGHSMGAVVSFELARYLRRTRQCADPLHLFVSGRRAPQLPDHRPSIHALPEPAFIEKLRELNGTPEAVLENAELFHLLLPLLRADFALCETYQYVKEKPLHSPITAFGGLQDREVSRTMLTSWQEQTEGAFKLRFFPGDHFFLHKQQSELLQVLSQDLLRSLH